MNLGKQLRKEYKKLIRMEDQHDMSCGEALQEEIYPELSAQRRKVSDLFEQCKAAANG